MVIVRNCFILAVLSLNAAVDPAAETLDIGVLYVFEVEEKLTELLLRDYVISVN